MGKRIKELLAADKVVGVFCLGQLCHPKFVEIVGLEGGHQAVWLDNEHAGVSIGKEKVSGSFVVFRCLSRSAPGVGACFAGLAPSLSASEKGSDTFSLLGIEGTP